MPMLQDQTSIAANSTTPDVLVNNVLAVANGFFLVEYGLVGSATGLILTLQVGTKIIAPNMRPSLANRFPIYPDDYLDKFGVIPGDRILLQAQNTTGGALTLFFAFKMTQVR